MLATQYQNLASTETFHNVPLDEADIGDTFSEAPPSYNAGYSPHSGYGQPSGFSSPAAGSSQPLLSAAHAYPPQPSPSMRPTGQTMARPAAENRTVWPTRRWGRMYSFAAANATLGAGVGSAIAAGAIKDLSDPHAYGYLAGAAAAAPMLVAGLGLACCVGAASADNFFGPNLNCGTGDCCTSDDSPDTDHARAHVASDLLLRAPLAAVPAAEAGSFAAIEMAKRGYGPAASVTAGIAAGAATAIGLVGLAHGIHTAYRATRPQTDPQPDV